MSEVEKLRQRVESFCRFVERLPRIAPADPEWGPHEVLAHLVFWHESYVEQIEAHLAARPFEPPQGRFRDLNAQAVAALQDVPIAELLRRFRAADERLRHLYLSGDPVALVLQIKQRGKARSLQELLPEIEAHVRNHQRKLER